MKYKKWTLDQKLEILSSGEEIGVVEACRKYSVSTGTFYSWKKKFEHKGEAGLKVTYDTKSKELKEAEEENRVLRKLLSDREIELEVQRELLKKSLGPIVIIDTENGDEIPDDPRIFGSMTIIQRPDGARNFVCDVDNDAYLDYSGTISIETRGSSSQSLPKNLMVFRPYQMTV